MHSCLYGLLYRVLTPVYMLYAYTIIDSNQSWDNYVVYNITNSAPLRK